MRFFTSPTSSPLNSPMKSSSSSPLKRRKPSPLRSKSSPTKSLTKSPTTSPKRRCRDDALYIALDALDKDPIHGANAGISKQVQNESNKLQKTYGCRGCTDYKIMLKKREKRITLLQLRASKAIAIANVEGRRKKRVFLKSITYVYMYDIF